ncbi:hypothetical protein K488DRAFT_82597 [Vararia minispora EC-137]|uniref:Uncharacterized protein n=1 Tax=Vararia minispora EC-137 TaxID=1314806 RepID=A0ACB8QWZ7_9AGAM|nr:hypothetical protein K488DRAFT_82597 [Vararia minispora EC-137]
MGNSASSSSKASHDESVDYGYLTPQGVYSGPRDWNESVVGRFIVERKLAPFYRPLEDYDESWDDDKILAARKEPPPSPTAEGDGQHPPRTDQASINSRHSHHHKRSTASKDPAINPEAVIYHGAVECPICFLFYPPNINRSRCCDQAICTECFVQIKRSEPTVTHLQSDPACCPYCVQEHFGVVYTPPPWRAGLGSEGSSLPPWPDTLQRTQSLPTSLGKQKRRKSFGPEDPDVVTIDHIRPDWEAKLQAVRAQAARRANRRIIMRQVGDRLIPVGVTSGRVHALPAELAGGEGQEIGNNGGSTGRRSRRRQQNEIANILGGMTGPDLEEVRSFLMVTGVGGCLRARARDQLMVMEAMRLSLLEHEAHQRREREAQAQNGGEGASNAPVDASEPAPLSASPTASPAEQTAPVVPAVAAASTSASPLPMSSLAPELEASTPPASVQGSSTPVQRVFPDTTPGPATPTTARAGLPPPVAPEMEGLSNGHLSSQPPIQRSNTALSTMTEDSIDEPGDSAEYGLLPSDSEESVVAREPLLRVADRT